MTRRLVLLNGLAILAVISHHAALNTLWWTDPALLQGTPPNYDQIDAFTYYILVAIVKLTLFSVPTFLLVSGFFIAYSARGLQSGLSWKMIRVRITNLLIPYLIWSLLIFLSEWAESCFEGCTLDSPNTYLTKLVLGRADSTYWYIIMICQLYLLSPLLVPLAKIHWRFLLLIASMIQISAFITTKYLEYTDAISPELTMIMVDLFSTGIVYFSLGIVIGFHLQQFTEKITRFKWSLFAIAIIFGLLSFWENDFSLRLIRPFTTIYAISFIFCFLAFDQVNIPYSNKIYSLSNKTFGLYLLHNKVESGAIKALYSLTPFLFTQQLLLQPIFITIGTGVPLLFMLLMAKSKLRGTYRYLFG